MIATKVDQHLRSTASRSYGDTPTRGEYPPPPDNLSMQCSDPPHLKYNIKTTDAGVLLSIWEPAPKSEVRVKPFLFMTRHRLASELEAKRLLAHYLSVYKAAARRI